MPEIFNPPSYTPSVLYQSAADWEGNSTVVLEIYQEGRETDTGKFKIGDGVTQWASLPYSTPDGSPFTGEAIDALDSGTPDSNGVLPFVDIVTGAIATATGTTTDPGTVGVKSSGFFTFSDNPAEGDFLPSINGSPNAIFSANGGNLGFPYLQIAGNAQDTVKLAAATLMQNRTTVGWTMLADAVYANDEFRLTIEAAVEGPDGDNITLGDDAGYISRSAATLENGVTAGTFTLGDAVFTVVASGASGQQINAGSTATTFAANIVTAVNANSTLTRCTASAVDDAITFTALSEGADGNDITISEVEPNLSVTSFTGGITGGYFLKKTTVAEIGQGVQGLQIITTAAGTTTLTVNSPPQTRFIGTDVQNVALPVVSTLPQIGVSYAVINDSSDVITVNSSGANLVQDIAPGANAVFMCIALTGTDATSWRVFYNSPGSVPAVVWDDDITTTQTDVGKAFDAPLGQTGGYTLTIDDALVYEAGACWTGSNLSDSTLLVTLANTPANLYLMDGGIVSNGAMDVPPGSSFVVRYTADGTFIISGNNLAVA